MLKFSTWRVAARCRLRAILVAVAMTTVTMTTVTMTAVALDAGYAAARPDSPLDLNAIADAAMRSVVADPDPFYAHTPPGADAPLGEILRIEPMAAPAVERTVPGVRGFRMLYVTTGPLGGRTTASASLFVPSATPPHGARALIGMGVADESMGSYCRPTSSMSRSSVIDQVRGMGPVDSASTALRAGHTVVVADLADDGGPSPTPTLLPRFDGHALLDAIRAARSVPAAGLTASSPIGIHGPSGGGSGAAAVAAEQAGTYAPELHIPAIMIGQMVPDHRSFIRRNSGTVGAGFAFADLLGLETGHPEMRIDDKLTAVGKRIADAFRHACAVPTYLTLSYVPLPALFRPGHSPWADPDFRRAFDAAALATPTSPTPTARLRLTRCDSNLSPVSVTPVDDLARAAATYRAKGARVTTRVVSCLGGPGDVYAPDLRWLLAAL
ncbi:lipase family protein [Gordonia polyisoprenivorans]|uniref:lipase family protein n=1 Tax=Gordonia polyisoprenivorans TaxID=84595 RepID=UPI0023019E76|nr:lipase family protein [Gordonia polyisoprenivorans]WCB38355.1 lipase family protein [Gordonia polyisoprenivorans]